MIPADTDDIIKEYNILAHEVLTFNPDLAEKPRVLAITKCDLIDDELQEMLREHLPDGVPTLFISAVAQRGLTELKDLLWRTINDERNRIPESLTQRDLADSHRVKEEDDFIFEAERPERSDQDPDAGGKMTWEDTERQWSDEYWEEDFIDENEDFQVVSDPDDALTKTERAKLQADPDAQSKS